MAKGKPIERMVRAFSDRTRLRILALLRSGEMCVGDLVEVLRLGQPGASRRLAYLRRAGLVSCRKQGPWRHYSPAPESTALHAKLLECLAEVPELAKDKERARKIREAGGCC